MQEKRKVRQWLLPLLFVALVVLETACSKDDKVYEFEGKGIVLSADFNFCMDYTHVLDMGEQAQVISLSKVGYLSGEVDIYVNKCVVVYGHYVEPVESSCSRVVVVEKIRELK